MLILLSRARTLARRDENEKKTGPARVLRLPANRRPTLRRSGIDSGVSGEWLRAHAIESAKRDR